MADAGYARTIDDYWGRDDLGQAILDALAASGKNLDALTIDDLAPMDHFHNGGKDATVGLARLAGLTPGLRVLDVGGGLGGPARTLAVEFGCHVTVIDLTESYVRAADELTARIGLGELVTHQVGNALELPFDDGTFDVVWTQNSGMNIADKERLYSGFHRVLRHGGLLALQEPMAGPVQPLIFPLMWAVDATTNFVRTPVEMRDLIEATGLRMRAWYDMKPQPARPASCRPDAEYPEHCDGRLLCRDHSHLAAQLRRGTRRCCASGLRPVVTPASSLSVPFVTVPNSIWDRSLQATYVMEVAPNLNE